MRSRSQLLTRGNTVLAGMLLISLLSAGALALDSFSMQRNPYGLTAMATLAQASPSFNDATVVQTVPSNSTAAPAGSKRTCQPGFDYQIRQEKTITNISCLQKFMCAGQTAFGCQNNAATPIDGGNFKQGTENQCKGVTDKSRVYYCIPKEFSRDGKSERCQYIKECSPGSTLDEEQVGKQYKPILVAEELAQATPEQKTAIMNAVQADPALEKGIFDAFDTGQQATQELIQDTQSDLQRINKELSALGSDPDCADPNSVACNNLRGPLEREQSRLQSQLQGLQQHSQRLADTKQQMQPKGPGTGQPQQPYAQAQYYTGGNTFDRSRLEQACLAGNQSACQQIARGGAGGPPGGSQGGLQPRAAGPQQPQRCSTFSSMIGSCQEYPKPTCMLSAQPSSLPAPTSSVTDGSNQQNQPPRNVTLTWQTQNAISAYLSSTGPVGPNGSMVVQPTGATTYTMTVTGPQNQQGQCSVHVGVGGQGSQGGGQGETGNPTAQISCEPKIADVGMKIAISYACQNAATAGASGFDTGGKLSGSTEATIEQPTLGVMSSIFGLTCSREGRTHSAQCAVQINKPTIVLVANPSKVHSGGDTTIGWVTAGMESCTISSPTLAIFTAEHEANKSTSGVAKTPQLAGETEFVLTCTTKAGGTHTAKTTVEIDPNATSWVGSIVARFL